MSPPCDFHMSLSWAESCVRDDTEDSNNGSLARPLWNEDIYIYVNRSLHHLSNASHYVRTCCALIRPFFVTSVHLALSHLREHPGPLPATLKCSLNWLGNVWSLSTQGKNVSWVIKDMCTDSKWKSVTLQHPDCLVNLWRLHGEMKNLSDVDPFGTLHMKRLKISWINERSLLRNDFTVIVRQIYYSSESSRCNALWLKIFWEYGHLCASCPKVSELPYAAPILKRSVMDIII